MTSFHSLFHKDNSLCLNCFNSMSPHFHRFKLNGISGLSLYPYDEFIQEKLYQLKGCHDIEIAPIFLEYFKDYLKLKYMHYCIVPAPSFIDADKERGFNHVIEIFKCLNLPFVKAVKKIINVKQADLTFAERQKVSSRLEKDETGKLSNKKILIVDDVMTTGATLKAMIELVKSENPKKIKILTMSYVSLKHK